MASSPIYDRRAISGHRVLRARGRLSMILATSPMSSSLDMILNTPVAVLRESSGKCGGSCVSCVRRAAQDLSRIKPS
jgi:hypothetical protein